MSSENNGWGARKAVVLQGSASRFAAATTALEIAVPSDAATAVRFRSRSWTNTCASIVVCTGRNQNPAERRLAGGVVQILLRSGALFATPFSAHPCRVLAHSVRIFCAFYAFSELSAKCSGCTGLLTEPLGLAWLSTEMLHLLCILRAFTCIYEPECRMRAECT